MSGAEQFPRVLVTGATGMLGQAVVAALLAEGRTVLALVRDRVKAARLLPDDPRLRVAVGDTTDAEVWDRLLPLVDGVIHAAAYFREFYGADHDRAGEARMWETNVTALERLLRAAARHGTAAVVHVSSVAALVPGTLTHPGDESSPLIAEPHAGYAGSKAGAELVVQQHPQGPRVPMISPSWMWGPGDAGPTSAGRLTLSVAREQLAAVPRCGIHMVDVRDVADACVRALRDGADRQRYVVAGTWTSLPEVTGRVATLRGVRTPRAVPAALALAAGAALEQVARLRGREPAATLAGVRALTRGHRARFSSARAERELGVRSTPIHSTVPDVLDWYVGAGWLDPVPDGHDLTRTRPGAVPGTNHTGAH